MELTDGTHTFENTITGTGDGEFILPAGTTLQTPNGATINFSGDLFQWQGGTINASGTLTNASTGVINVAPGSINNLSGTLTNDGLIRNDSGSIQFASAAINNLATGTYETRGEALLDLTSGASVFNNIGTFQQVDALGDTTGVIDVNFVNSGLVDIDADAVSVTRASNFNDGGTFDIAPLASFDLTNGTHNFRGTTTGTGGGAFNLGPSASITTPTGEPATLDFAGDLFQWVGGIINATGGLINEGTLNLTGPGVRTLVSGTLTNNDTIRQTGGAELNFANGVAIQNNGLFEFQEGVLDLSSGTSSFNNNDGGVFDKTTAGVGTIDVAFVNNANALLEVSEGTLSITRAATFNDGNDIDVEAIGTLSFDSGAHIFNGTTTGTGAGSVLLHSPSSFSIPTGATFNFADDLFQWESGSITATGGLTNANQINVVTGGSHSLGGTLNNDGLIEHSGGGELNFTSAAINNRNGATYLLRDGDLDLSSGASALNNETGAIFRKDDPSVSSFDIDLMDVGGTIDVVSGTLNFTNNASGSTFEDSTIQIATGAQINVQTSINFEGDVTGTGGGTFALPAGGTLSAPNDATMNFAGDLFQWQGGNINTAGTLTNDGQLNIVGADTHTLAGTLNNNGLIVHDATGDLNFTTATVNNNGVYDLRDGLLDIASGATLFNNNNGGTFLKTTAGDDFIDVMFANNNGAVIDVQNGDLQFTTGAFFNDGGTVQVAAPGTISFPSATHTFAGTTTGTGTGLVRFNGGTLLATGGNAATLDFAADLLEWQAGTFQGTDTIINVGEINITTAAVRTLGGNLRNEGTINHDDGAQLNFTSATLTNATGGRYDLRDGRLDIASGTTSFVNQNGATLEKTTASISTFDVGLVNNAGLLDVTEGELSITTAALFNDGSTINVDAAGILSFPAATHQFSGVTTGTGDGLARLNGGQFSTPGGEPGTLNFAPGLLEWQSGLITPNAGLTNAGDLAVTTAAARTLTFGTLFNSGTLTLLDNSQINFTSATLNNQSTGVIEVVDGNLAIASGATAISNAGLIRKTTTSANTTNIAVTNQTGGLIDVQVGSLALNGAFNTSGDVNVDTVGVLATSNPYTQIGNTSSTTIDGALFATNVVINNGLLSGNGTIFGNVNNTGGTVAAGSSPGVLAIDGDFTQGGGGTLEVELGGLIAGDDFDLLTISGDANFAGTLDVVLINGFEPTVGDDFTIATYASASGAFDTVTGLNSGINADLQLTQDPTELRLNAVIKGASSATANLVGNDLQVTGDATDDGIDIIAGATDGEVRVVIDSSAFDQTFFGVDILTIDAGDGNDTVAFFGALTDTAGNLIDITLDGGEDNDTFVINDFALDLTINEQAGDGNDTLDFTPVVVDLDFDLNTGVIAVTSFGANGTVSHSQNEIENLIGGSGNDVFLISDNFDLAGGNGTIDGGGSPGDQLNYSGNTRQIDIDLFAATATGLSSVTGVEDIHGGLNDDNLRGDNNENEIRGGGGNDLMEGRGGGDTYVFVQGRLDGNSTIVELAGGGSDDVIDLSGTTDNLTVNIGSLTITNGTGTITHAGDEVEFVDLGSGDDVVIFADQAVIDAELGGGGGIDTLDYSAYTTAVTVDVVGGTATGTNGIVDFENFITADTATVINSNDSGAGSLRDAIIAANNAADDFTINFAIDITDPGFIDIDAAAPGGDAQVDVVIIALQSALPALNNANGSITLDGLSQTAAIGDTNQFGAEIVLDGTNAGVADGLVVQSDSNTLSNLVIQNFNGDGIFFDGGSNNVVIGSFIGVDATGTVGAGNEFGIVMLNGASDNIIGGVLAAERNVISGNTQTGVHLFGSDVIGNTILGNLIGTDASGLNAIANGNGGVFIGNASDNTVGTAAAGNIISGNTGNGLSVVGSLATGNMVHGNFIGTTIDGDAALGNTANGIFNGDGGGFAITPAAGYASGNFFGGINPGEGNVLSGNATFGYTSNSVGLAGTGNAIQGNFIGTDATGTFAIGNQLGGMLLHAQNNLIGGTGSAGNVISGNAGAGITISGNFAVNNTIQGNRIGTDASGGSDLGNDGDGIVLTDVGIGTPTSSNTIGGLNAGEGNTIAFNQGNGVSVENGSTGNTISGNAIFENDGLGIDLNNDGPDVLDANDVDGGSNNTQNFPVLFTAQVVPGLGTIINGDLNSVASTTFRIEVFSNFNEDPTGFGEGELFVDSFEVTTDGAGNVFFDELINFEANLDDFISVTATNLTTGDTSEFSTNALVEDAPPTADLVPPTVIAGATELLFEIVVDDGEGVDVATLIDNDSAFRVTGPNGFDELATFVDIDDPTDGSPRTVTLRINSPGKAWNGDDNGTYTVTVESGQVFDLSGNELFDVFNNTFDVNILGNVLPPNAVLQEFFSLQLTGGNFGALAFGNGGVFGNDLYVTDFDGSNFGPGRVHRLVDLDANGTANDAGESSIALDFNQSVYRLPIGIDFGKGVGNNFGTDLFLNHQTASTTTRAVLRMSDLTPTVSQLTPNGTFFNQSGMAMSADGSMLLVNEAGAFTVFGGGADGRILAIDDQGNSTIFADGSNTPRGLHDINYEPGVAPDGTYTLINHSITNGVFDRELISFKDLNGDGDANDAGEAIVQLADARFFSQSGSATYDAAGNLYLATGAEVYRLEDLNGDGNFDDADGNFDAGEVTLFAEGLPASIVDIRFDSNGDLFAVMTDTSGPNPVGMVFRIGPAALGAFDANVVGGELQINATNGADDIQVLSVDAGGSPLPNGQVRVVSQASGFDQTFNGVDTLLIDAGEGDDVITVDTNLLSTTGQPVDSQIFGRGGNDVIVGGNGNDIISGGAGNDIINGGAGNDQLLGDAGDDSFLFDNNFGTDTVDESANNGNDTMDFTNVTAPLTFTLGNLAVTDGTNAVTHNGDNIEKLIGGSNNDTFVFPDQAVFNGGNGIIDGGAGNDTLDYSAYTTQVDAVLGGGATGLAGNLNIETALNVQIVIQGDAQDVTSPQTTQIISIEFTDQDNVDVSTLDSNDLLITGPNGFSSNATFLGVNLGGDGVTRVATYRLNGPGGSFDAADNGQYSVQLQANQVADSLGNFFASSVVAFFETNIDGTLPTAVVDVPNLRTPTNQIAFNVTYNDDVGVDVNSLNNAIQVTGTNGFSQIAQVQNIAASGNGFVVTYFITAPDGVFDFNDNAFYRILLRANQLLDTNGNFAPAQELDTFRIKISSTA